MKNIKYKIAILSILFAFTSCEDSAFLDQVPYSFVSPENYYKTIADFENALVGCYSAINTNVIAGKGGLVFGNYGAGIPHMLSTGTDISVINSQSGGNDYHKVAIAAYGPVNTSVENLWIAQFGAVQRCNFLLNKASEIGLEDPVRQNEIVAEARFLRAFFYYHLTVFFGGVPLNVKAELQPFNPRASVEAIFNQIILPDLEEAYKVLPDRAKTLGRASKWSAAGYLGAVCNYLASCKRYNVGEELNFPLNSFSWVDENQMNQKAKTVLKDIIDNSGYVLIDKYDYLFRETTKSYQYQEALFTIENPLVLSDHYTPIANFLGQGGPNTAGGAFSVFRPLVEFFLSYNGDLDVRRSHNITVAPFNTNSPTEEIEGVKYYVPTPATNATFWNNQPGKWRHSDPKGKIIPPSASGMTIPVLRYADILLHYAEALYFTGDEVTARTYLTQVRSRIVAEGHDVSELDAEYHKDDFVEELLDERKRELCFEAKRRIDLIRFGIMGDVINALDASLGPPNTKVSELQENWEDFKIWYPIPQRELDLNSNLEQNPGY